MSRKTSISMPAPNSPFWLGVKVLIAAALTILAGLTGPVALFVVAVLVAVDQLFKNKGYYTAVKTKVTALKK